MDEEIDAEAIYTRGLKDGVAKGVKYTLKWIKRLYHIDIASPNDLTDTQLEEVVKVVMKEGRPE